MLDRFRSKLAETRERVMSALEVARGALPSVAYSALSPWEGMGSGIVEQAFYNGSKFEGGFGPTRVYTADYWTLRARSAQLFKTNLYARGLIRRLVTNEIAVGLHLEATPAAKLLGQADDALADWSEDVEERFAMWQSDPWLCDHQEQNTFGQLQTQVRMESLIEGDVLCVMRQSKETNLPRVQIILGSAVRTPVTSTLKVAKGERVVEGVHLDAQGRHLGYWVTQPDQTSKYLPASGEKSGRRIAWMVYGTEKRHDEVRGEPLLSLVLQSMREIDRYRDSTQRKAVVNSMLAMFVKSAIDKASSRVVSSGAVRKGSLVSGTGGDPAAPRRFNAAGLIPGWVIEKLQPGEEPVAFPSHGTDEKFGDFERAIIQAIAWAHEIPPEILMLSFNSNYSASQAALNEFKIYLNKVRTRFGDTFCTPIYQQWLLSMVLSSKVKAPQLLESWRDKSRYDVFAAWVACDWSGNIKPSIDLPKLVAGYKALVAEGWITRDRASRELTGTKYSQNAKKLLIENKQLVEASRSLRELDPKFANAAAAESDDKPAPAEDDNDASDAAEDAHKRQLRVA